MPDTRETFAFTRAADYTGRHAVLVALVAPPNAGKTYSGCRICKGAAEAQGKRFAVIDTEGGRTLHLRKEFDFDITMLDEPHRPERYLEAARAAQDKGYGALLIDSFTMEWRGPGGVLSWMDDELEAYVERQRAFAESKNWTFDEVRTRNAGKSAASIRPKVAHKEMMFGLLGLRIPIVLSVRGENTYDPDTKKEVFKPQCNKGLLFEVTCSFRLAADKKGVIDLSDPLSYKMEGSHAGIFKNGQLISEEHGRLLNAWATNAPLPDEASSTAAGSSASARADAQTGAADKTVVIVDGLIARIKAAGTEDAIDAIFAEEVVRKQVDWMLGKRPEEHKRLYDFAKARRAELKGAT